MVDDRRLRNLLTKMRATVAASQDYRSQPVIRAIVNDTISEWADELDAILTVSRPPEETPAQEPPAVHHCCKPSNLEGAPAFAMWCSLEREYVDRAAKQFDYKCSHCGQRITVNVRQWRAALPVPVPPEETPQQS